MSSFPYRNGEYRDELVQYAHPFDEQSQLELDDIYIGADLFLDAVLFFKSAVELPVRISSIDGTAGTLAQFQINLVDHTGLLVGQALVDSTEDAVQVYNEDQVQVGTFLFEQATLQRFSASVAGRLVLLDADTAVFSLDVSHVATAPYARYIAASNGAAHGEVRMVARHGCKFVVESGVISLDVLSDPAIVDSISPVLSINGVIKPSVWLANHPEANVRIHTKSAGIHLQAVTDRN